MDTRKIDAIARNLASATSRRSVVGGLLGGALAVAGLSRAAGAPADKVDICHYDDETDTYQLINVSGNAVEAHMNHGDLSYHPAEVLASFTLAANNPNPVDTGVFLADGDSVSVMITGTAGWCCSLELDANGSAPCGFLGIPFNCGSVVGVIGGGNIFSDYTPFFEVGTDEVVTASGTSGNLVLQYVDGCASCYGDNNGSLLVTISSIATC